MRLKSSLQAFLFLVVSLVFVSAVILVNDDTTAFASVNDSTQAMYNFSVNNTQATENITEINVTLPSGFVFISGSNETDLSGTSFSNTSSVLTWDGANLTNGSLNYFVFNATSSATPGSYNFTITTSNTSGVFETQNLSVLVNDTKAPVLTFVSPSTNNSNMSTDVFINVSAVDLGTLENISIRLYNSSIALINSTIGTGSPVSLNVSGLTDGVYYYNASANDSLGHTNNSGLYKLLLDSVDPTVTLFICTDSAVDIGGTITCTCTGSDASSGVALVNYTRNPSTAASGTITTTCIVTDNAGNSASSSTTYMVNAASGGSSSGSSGYYPIYIPSVMDLSNGYSVSLGKGFSVDFSVLGGGHSLKVDSISSSKATITVSSSPTTFDLSVGETKKVDVDGNGIYDVNVYLKDITSNRANIVMTTITEEVPGYTSPAQDSSVEDTATKDIETKTSPITGQVVGDFESLSGFWVVLVIVIFALGVLAFIYKKELKNIFNKISK